MQAQYFTYSILLCNVSSKMSANVGKKTIKMCSTKNSGDTGQNMFFSKHPLDCAGKDMD